MRGPVRRIWLGQRDLELLIMHKDPGTALAIKQILFHAQSFDKLHGKQTFMPN